LEVIEILEKRDTWLCVEESIEWGKGWNHNLQYPKGGGGRKPKKIKKEKKGGKVGSRRTGKNSGKKDAEIK